MMGMRLRRITRVEVVLWGMAILVPLVLVARVPSRGDIVDGWLEVQRGGDVEQMMERLVRSRPSLDLYVGGHRYGTAWARSALEWRVATGSSFEVEALIEKDDADARLALLVRERSRVYDLLGVAPRYQMMYWVRNEKIAREFAVPADPGVEAAVAESLEAFAEWLGPRERKALFRDGRPHWTGRTAERWLDRLEAWRAVR